MSSSGDDHVPHVLAPSGEDVHGHAPRKCLLWACKACKKKTVTIDRRKQATLRERRRLRRVSDIKFQMHLLSFSKFRF